METRVTLEELVKEAEKEAERQIKVEREKEK
jgi:hypothetical protein